MTSIEPLAVHADAVDEAKTYLRIEHDEEDALIASMIAVAIRHGEGFTRTIFITRNCRARMPVSTAWQRLIETPVSAIIGVDGVPDSGPAFTLPSTAYALDVDSNGDGWVRTTDPGASRWIEASYRAGLADDWAALPEALRQGVLRLTAHLHAVRDDPNDAGPPAAVAALWRPWRRMRLT